MNIQFFKAFDLETNIKATIHLSGRLGFNTNALKKLNLDDTKYVKIGFGDSFEKDKILYLVISTEIDKETFSVSKAGEYYYANTKALFDYLSIDYVNNKIMYDISEVQGEDGIYQLKPRIKERKKNEDDLE